MAKNRQNGQNNAKFFYTDKSYMFATSQELNLGVFYGVGNLVQRYVYSPSGKITRIENAAGADITQTPMVENFFTFTGREFDKESELFYFRARYYDIETGRFIQSDPNAGAISRPSSFNSKYMYVENNPVKFTDPSGERIQGPSIYGNWCGPYDNNGQGDNEGTKDAIDRECKGHDEDYLSAENYQAPLRGSGNLFAPEISVVAETGHYFYHRFAADVELVGELSFNHNSWNNNRGNFDLIQFTKANAASAYFANKNIKLIKNGPNTLDQIFFGIDKYKMITWYGKSFWNRLSKIF